MFILAHHYVLVFYQQKIAVKSALKLGRKNDAKND